MHSQPLADSAAPAQLRPDHGASLQAPFFGHMLMRVSRSWRQVLETRLHDLGLTDATWVPLFHLHEAGEPLTLKQLAQRVGLDSSTLVRVVDLLESRGWAVRATDTQDRRSKSLRLTPEGLHVVADVRAKLHQVETLLLQDMDTGTIAALRHGMQQLHEKLQAIQAQDKAQDQAQHLSSQPQAADAPAQGAL